jgi:hypothetical protein
LGKIQKHPKLFRPNFDEKQSKIAENINFLDQILAKAIEKSLIFVPVLGHRKFFLDRAFGHP